MTVEQKSCKALVGKYVFICTKSSSLVSARLVFRGSCPLILRCFWQYGSLLLSFEKDQHHRPSAAATSEHAMLLQVTNLEKLPYNLQTELRFYNNAAAVCCDPMFTVLSPADQASISAEQPSTDDFADTPGQLAA